jgi:hypothetical protein
VCVFSRHSISTIRWTPYSVPRPSYLRPSVTPVSPHWPFGFIIKYLNTLYNMRLAQSRPKQIEPSAIEGLPTPPYDRWIASSPGSVSGVRAMTVQLIENRSKPARRLLGAGAEPCEGQRRQSNNERAEGMLDVDVRRARPETRQKGRELARGGQPVQGGQPEENQPDNNRD